MIEKLNIDPTQSVVTNHCIINKINEIIDLLNAIVVDVDGTKCIDGSKKPEPAELDIPKSYKNDQLTSELKCPFCQQELQEDVGYDGDYSCPNCTESYFGSPELWQELIRTRKALEIAVDALKDIDNTRSVANHKIGTQNKTLNSGIVFCWTTPDEIHNALEQITALEQKDVK